MANILLEGYDLVSDFCSLRDAIKTYSGNIPEISLYSSIEIKLTDSAKLGGMEFLRADTLERALGSADLSSLVKAPESKFCKCVYFFEIK